MQLQSWREILTSIHFHPQAVESCTLAKRASGRMRCSDRTAADALREDNIQSQIMQSSIQDQVTG